MKKSKGKPQNVEEPLDLTPVGEDMTPEASMFHGEDGVTVGCPVCEHPEKATIGRLVYRWTPWAELEELTGISGARLRAHFKATGELEKRSHNTDAMISELMEKRMDSIDPKEIKIEALIKHRDKLNKRVDNGAQEVRPTVIVIQGPPTRDKLIAKGGTTLTGVKVIPVLPPGGGKKEGS